MMYVQNTSVVSLGPRLLKRSRKMWTQKIESQIFLDLGIGRTKNSQLLNINLAVVFWWIWAVETAKSLKQGVGRREQVSQCWKPVSLKQKGFVVVVIYLFVCVSGSLWAGFQMGIPKSKYPWTHITASLVYNPFIYFSGNRSHCQVVEAYCFTSGFLNLGTTGI